MDKKLIKKQLRESLLTEFVGQEMVSLKRYFSMTDEEKKSYLPHEYPYEFETFLYEEGLETDIEGEPYEITDILFDKNPNAKLFTWKKDYRCPQSCYTEEASMGAISCWRNI
jgi:hypothetical protein